MAAASWPCRHDGACAAAAAGRSIVSRQAAAAQRPSARPIRQSVALDLIAAWPPSTETTFLIDSAAAAVMAPPSPRHDRPFRPEPAVYAPDNKPGRNRRIRLAGGSPLALLELRGVAKHFGAIEALKGVDLEIAPGEVVGLMGDNGAGKSTLVKI